MGLGGISIWQLLIILAIVVMLFGTSRLRNIGGALGNAIKGFRDSMKQDKPESDAAVASVVQEESSPEPTSAAAAREESDIDKPPA